jgi:hypothetical protein
MAVPTSYTYDEFADYLKDEVLRDAAEGIGYGDLVPGIPAIAGRIEIRASGTPPYNFTSGIPIYQPGFSVAVATSLTFSNGATRTLATALTPTSTTMNINGLGAGFNPGDYASVQLRAAVARVRNPIYDVVTNEVLVQMGLSAIGDVNAENVAFFRQFGRIEILRKAMQNVAGSYTTNMPVGGSVNSNNVYTNIASMFERERSRLNQTLTAGSVTVGAEATPSANLGVTLVW